MDHISGTQCTCLLLCSDCSLDSSHDTDRSVFLDTLNCGAFPIIADDTDFPLAIRGGAVADDVRLSDGLGNGGIFADSTAFVMCSADC